MATWEDLQQALGQSFTLDVVDVDQVTLTLPLRDGRANRAQRVMVQHFASWGEPMVEVRSAFGECLPDEAGSLMASNLDLPLGAVALHGKYLVLVQKLPLRMITIEGVVWTLLKVAELADVLEERRGGDRF